MSSGRVAPHQFQEVRLVLAGRKPLATIERSKDESGYAQAISLGAAGMLHTYVRPTVDDCTGEVVFTKPSNAKLITRYVWLLKNGVSTYGVKENHRKLGRLFGYTEADIEAFINAEVHCDCTKCKGTNPDL